MLHFWDRETWCIVQWVNNTTIEAINRHLGIIYRLVEWLICSQSSQSIIFIVFHQIHWSNQCWVAKSSEATPLAIPDKRGNTSIQSDLLNISLHTTSFDFVSSINILVCTGLTLLRYILAARCISIFRHITWFENDVPVHMVLCRNVDLSVSRPPRHNWKSWHSTHWIDQVRRDSNS